VPQWDCACPNCVAVRSGRIAPQTQSSIGVRTDHQRLFLINASPDLARQIESTPELQPLPKDFGLRNSPIESVLLTNADLDHCVGLLLMRQRTSPLVIYTTDKTRAALGWIEIVLKPFCRIEWCTIASDFQSLGNGIGCRAIELGESIALQLCDEVSGATALVAPGVGKITHELREAVDHSDLVLFDGTFWSDDELQAVRPGARSGREMNHLPISDGSLDLLRNSPVRRKIYTHINNTNPILMPTSSERIEVEDAGVEIAYDGLEVVL
jgi:pyrroloquinoline quinone biosynthesis protein B